MSAVMSKKKRDRQSAIQASTGHSVEGGNSPISSFRTPRSDDPESSASASARHSGEGRNPVAEPVREHQIETANVRSANTPLGDLCAPRVSQDGPKGRREFVYVDISSIDRETKQIVDPKTLPASKAPSRARQVLKRGDVLVSMTRPNLNAVAIVPPSLDGAIGSTGFHVLRAKDTDPAFLFYAVQTPAFIDAMCQKVQGALYPAVRPRDISSFCIPCPSRNEQLGIVAEIEKQFTRLDAGVAALRRVQANLKRYRAAVLKAACEGRLVPTEVELARAEGRTYETGEQLLARILADRRKNWHGRGKYKEPAVPDTTNLPLLPEGWTWVTMPQLGELARGKSKHRPRDDAKLYGGPYPFIQTGDVRKSNGTVCDYTQTYSEFGLQQSRLWPAGTLCITIAANIAETGILNFDACFPDSVVGFVQDVGPSTTRYLEFFVRTAREKLEQFAPATAQKNINLDVLQKVAIPLPPLAEQARIVAEVERRLSIIEELEAAVAPNLQRATRLRQSVLRRAFE
jgi:type I restriction enzyme S subunit